jgi:hypothetical protein
MTAALCVLLVLALMGAFDTIVYHELVARLPATPTAWRELRLHAARDFVYGVLFATLAWLQPHGWLVLPLALLLATEITITLSDFIVEDGTRKLPSGERSMHAIMGITYGIFVALLFPQALGWVQQPTGFAAASYGWLSWALTLFALGVVSSGVRDIIAAGTMRASHQSQPVPR